MESPVLVWFRDDLRCADNPALAAAAKTGQPVSCIYILDDATGPTLGAASRWWLHGSLEALDASLKQKGNALLLFAGPAEKILHEIVKEGGFSQVFWNRRYEEEAIDLDSQLKIQLQETGITVESFNANLLNEPWTIKTKDGGSFKVFSAFWRAVVAKGEPASLLPEPQMLPKRRHSLSHVRSLDSLNLEPKKPNWAEGFGMVWSRGEAGAQQRLKAFLHQDIKDYAVNRDRPDLSSTSRLSPHLRFGEIGPRQIWHEVRHVLENSDVSQKDADKFLQEIGWRDFSYHLLFHHPDLAKKNFLPRFDAFPWLTDKDAYEAWRRGRTGYPIVDAGLRQLWQIGWMHNRVRMIAASFLIKHLLIDWRQGGAWFWDTLVDADPANNAASWQWVAGSGADAAPYFRIFNPILQGEKFDPDGVYVRRWVPELSKLSNSVIHQPWTASQAELDKAGIKLGRDYPAPIVAHEKGRERALAALKQLKEA